MTNAEIRKKILDFCYKDVLEFTSLYVEKNKGKNWLEVNMSSEFNDLVDKLYQAVIELLLQEIEKAREEGKKEERTSILERLEELREVELNGEGLFSLDSVIKVIRKLKSGSKCEMETLPYFRMELWVGEEKFACQSFIDSQEIKDMYYKDMVIEKMRRDFEKMIRATDEYLLSKLKDSK